MGTLKDIFGICPVCGSDGGDDPAASGADAPATTVSGSGVPLKYHNAVLMCDLCIKERKADEESLKATEHRAEEERFRNSAGFTNTI